MDILTNVLRVLMVVATVLNAVGFVTSMKNAQRYIKEWKRAMKLADALSELHDEFVREQATEAYINIMDKGEEQ